MRSVGAYVAWAVSGILWLAGAFALRGLAMKLYMGLFPSVWTLEVADKVIAIILILTWLVAVLMAESLFRRAADRKRLGRVSAISMVPAIVDVVAGYIGGVFE